MKRVERLDGFDRHGLDQEIMRRVRSVECDVPAELENAFLDEIETIIPMPQPKKKRGPRVYGIMAAAATILVTVLTVLFPLFDREPEIIEAQGVVVREAKIEGQSAQALVVSPKDADMTIVWVEKTDDAYADET